LQVSPGTIGTATGTGTTGTTIIPAPEAMSSACYLISDRGVDSPNQKKQLGAPFAPDLQGNKGRQQRGKDYAVLGFTDNSRHILQV